MITHPKIDAELLINFKTAPNDIPVSPFSDG